MKRQSTHYIQHEYPTWLSSQALVEAMQKDIEKDFLYLDQPKVQVVQEDLISFGIHIDGHRVGDIVMGEDTWNATLIFEAEFDYHLYNSMDDDEPPFQAIVDSAITFKEPKVYDWFHMELQCDIVIIYPNGECITAVLANAYDQAAEDNIDNLERNK